MARAVCLSAFQSIKTHGSHCAHLRKAVVGSNKLISSVSYLSKTNRSQPESVSRSISRISGMLPLVKRRVTRRSSASDAYETNANDAITEVSSTEAASTSNVMAAVAMACIGAFLFGYHLGVVNGPLEQILTDLSVKGNTIVGGWIVSITLAGAFFGAILAGIVADTIGRTRTLQLNAIFLFTGSLLSGVASTVLPMLAGRALVGVGIGVSSSVVPLFVSEIAPTSVRGLLGTANQLAICVGILAALVAGLPMASNPSWWRTMFFLPLPLTVLLALGMMWAPESPRWLYNKGRVADAEEAAGRLWGKHFVEQAMAELAGTSDRKGEEKEAASWQELLSPRYSRVMGVAAAIFLLQQLAGINAVIYFSSSVFRRVGVASDTIASALVGLANVLGTGVASTLMDRAGRKTLLGLSFGGMGISMLLLALSLSWSVLQPFSGFLAVAGTIAYVLSFSIGAGPVPALLLPEIFPLRVRGQGVAVGMAVHWVCNFLIGFSFLTVVNAVGVSSVYFFFACACAVGVLFTNTCIVETKGKSLEEIEVLYGLAK